MSTEHVPLSVEDGLGILRLARVEKRNALNESMVKALLLRCLEVDARDDIDVLILTGTGDSFCSGGDIDDWSARDATAFGRRWVRDGHSAFDQLARLRQPVIVALNGHALGGGLELAACGDYRIAEDHIKIGQPEAGLGIIAGWSGTQRATRRFGAQAVRRMALFGEIFDAATAHSLGIVDKVTASGNSLQAARALAQTLLARSRTATELTKMLLNAAEGEETERVLESLAGRVAAEGNELREGISAFREKRSPQFKA